MTRSRAVFGFAVGLIALAGLAGSAAAADTMKSLFGISANSSPRSVADYLNSLGGFESVKTREGKDGPEVTGTFGSGFVTYKFTKDNKLYYGLIERDLPGKIVLDQYANALTRLGQPEHIEMDDPSLNFPNDSMSACATKCAEDRSCQTMCLSEKVPTARAAYMDFASGKSAGSNKPLARSYWACGIALKGPILANKPKTCYARFRFKDNCSTSNLEAACTMQKLYRNLALEKAAGID